MMAKGFESFQKSLETARRISFAGGAMAWLEPERTLAQEHWLTKGLPSRKDEAWKYTSVNSLAESEIVESPAPSHELLVKLAPVRERAKLAVNPVAELVFINGRYCAEWSTPTQAGGLTVLPLSEALKAGNASLDLTLSSLRNVFASKDHKGSETAFAALNTTFFSDAAVIVSAERAVAASPVVLTFIHTTGGSRSWTAAFPRVFAAFGAQSEVSVIENHVGAPSEKYLAANVTDAHIGGGARVSYVRLQREGDQGFHLGTSRFFQARDSRLESLQLSLGARLSRQDLKVRLAASGAEAVVDGLYIVRGEQHVDNHTAIEHAVGDTNSEQLYKGILDDQSRAVFNGRVWIAKDAQKSNSSQLNNNLMLSLKAEVDTKPELEIFADDVKAAHGATVGRLDREQLFYFESRAIPESEAVPMLAHGFAQDLVLRRTNEALRQSLSAPVAESVRGLKVRLS